MSAAPAVADDAREVTLRGASPPDGLALFRLVERSEALELNTAYCYVVLSDHFRDTTVVAELGGEVVGFVAAYRPPTHSDTVFVWQVGVDASARGRGVAGRLLDALVRRPACHDVRYLEATVDPDNAPSRRLFEAFARRHAAPFAWSEGYSSALLGGDHPPEPLIRVGPFSAGAEPS